MAGPHPRAAAAGGDLAALRQEPRPAPGVALGDRWSSGSCSPTSRSSRPSPRGSASRGRPRAARSQAAAGGSRAAGPPVQRGPARPDRLLPRGRHRQPVRHRRREDAGLRDRARSADAARLARRIRERLDELYRSEDVVTRLLEGIGGDFEVKELEDEEDDGRQRRGGEPAADHPAGRHDAGRRHHQPGERHPRRADRGRRRGALPHRRRAAPGDEDSAQRRHSAHLPHQDHVRARHRRPAAAAGRARPRRGERRAGRPPRLDPAGLARREGRHPDPEPAATVLSLDALGLHEDEQDADPEPAPATRKASSSSPGPTGSGKTTTLYSALRHDPERGRQHRHGRRPGRVPAGREHRAGAGPREGGAHLRLGAALDPPAGPRRRADRRDPRPGDGADRASRRRSPATWCSPRCTPTTRPTRSPGWWTWAWRRTRSPPRCAASWRSGSCGGSARACQEASDRARARAGRAVHPRGHDAVRGGRLPRVRHDRLSRPVQHRRGADDERRDRAAASGRAPPPTRSPRRRGASGMRSLWESGLRHVLAGEIDARRAAAGHRRPARGRARHAAPRRRSRRAATGRAAAPPRHRLRPSAPATAGRGAPSLDFTMDLELVDEPGAAASAERGAPRAAGPWSCWWRTRTSCAGS